MKKLLLLPAVALMMASCGGEDICSCKKARKEMSEKMDAAKDKKAMAALEEEYKDQAEECEALEKDLTDGLEGDELKAKKKELKEEWKACK